MRLHSSIVAGFAAFLCLSACATDESVVDGSESSEGVTETETETAQADRVIATVELGYATVEFHAVQSEDGSTLTYVTDERSIYMGETPLDQLLVAKAPTGLELFLAIAPDQDPPQELVDTHESETQQENRSSAEVRTLEFDLDAVVPKGTAAACTNLLANDAPAGYNATNWTNLNGLSGWSYTTIGGDDYFAAGKVSAGLCNESTTRTATMRLDVSYYNSLEHPPVVHGTMTVAPQKAKWWHPLSYTISKSCGPGCVDIDAPQYRTTSKSIGTGANYRTRHCEYSPIL